MLEMKASTSTQGAALLLCLLWLACSPPASCYPVSGAHFDGPLLLDRATDNDCQHQQSVKAGSYGYLKTAPLDVLQQLTAMGRIDIEHTSILSPRSDLESLTVRREGRWGVTECRGVAVASKNRKTVLRVFVSDSGGKPDKPHHLPLFFLLDSETLQQTVQRQGNITFIYSCMGVGVQCLKITFEGLMDAQDMDTPLMKHNLLQRSIRKADQSLLPHNHHSHVSLLTVLAVLGVTVIGIVGLIAILALCAGGSTKTYETQVSTTAPVKRAADDVARNSIIEVGETVKNGALTSNGEKQSGTNAEPQEAIRKSSSPGDATDSSDRATSPGEESESQKTRSMSARSQAEPLPEIPLTFDDAKCNKQKSVANDEEAGYAYARVSQSEQMEGSESEGEEEGSTKHVPPGDSSCPPDVEVSRHPTHDERASSEPPEGESYAEVRETPRYPLTGKGRLRSATEPIEPTFVPTTRDKRAGTESATHLPLPSIPSMEVNEDITYDSIPDDMKSNDGVAPKPQVPIQRRKERLYESMDDMDEDDEGPDDMYESVPDEIKHVQSPSTPKLPVVPLPPPSPKHFPTSPAPPASPIPRKADRKDKKDDHKKKIAKSISDSENRKRSFSFFSRKKTPSISAGAGKTRRDQEPLPDVPVTLSLLSPPAIPPPSPPDDNEEDEIDQMYDQPDRSHVMRTTSNVNSSPRLRRADIDVAKAKSASLPSSMRTAGGSVFHPPNIPLPEVPEDSGSGAVVVGRPVSVNVENEPNYDVVIHDKDGDEPNYESVNQEDILRSIGEEKEPGYDKVGGKLPSEGAEGVGPVSPDDKEAPTKVAGYGKVTSHGGDSAGVTPDHDDLGYAVVPQEFKVRKRTMSSSKTRPVVKKEGDPGYVSVKELKEPDYDTIQQAETEPGYDSIKPIDQGSRETTPSSPTLAPIEEQYASVDLEAKHESRKQNVPSLQLNDDGLPTSPAPPPVPPAEDLGVDLSEFTEPPIPVQLEGVHELITVNDPGYSRVLRSAGATNGGKDPPYAKIMIKDEPPYATVMKLREDVQENADFGYDSADVVVKKPSDVTEQDKSKALGYDVIGEKDDIIENGETPVSPVKSELERNMPKLATAEGELKQPLYDSLEPAEDTTTEWYDSLQPTKKLAEEQLIDMDDDDDRYETIDGDKRKNLREKFHKSSH